MKKISFNRKNNSLIILFIILFVMTIGYSLISSGISYLGFVNVSGVRWNVHFDNIKVMDGSVSTSDFVTTSDSTKIDYMVKLGAPDDYYDFTFDVINDGTIPAKLKEITIPKAPDYLDKYIVYNVTYDDGSAIIPDEILLPKEKKKVKVYLGFNDSVNLINIFNRERDFDLTFDLFIDLRYVQVDDNGNDIIE